MNEDIIIAAFDAELEKLAVKDVRLVKVLERLSKRGIGAASFLAGLLRPSRVMRGAGLGAGAAASVPKRGMRYARHLGTKFREGFRKTYILPGERWPRKKPEKKR